MSTPMKSALNPFQKAVYDRLTGAISAPVYDEVPRNAVPPYVVIGEDTESDAGTKTDHGGDLTALIHVWSAAPGWHEAKAIIGDCLGLLTGKPLEVPGFQAGQVRREFVDLFRDPDGVTRHGVLRLGCKVFQQD